MLVKEASNATGSLEKDVQKNKEIRYSRRILQRQRGSSESVEPFRLRGCSAVHQATSFA
jgi:hypothetical protein